MTDLRFDAPTLRALADSCDHIRASLAERPMPGMSPEQADGARMMLDNLAGQYRAGAAKLREAVPRLWEFIRAAENTEAGVPDWSVNVDPVGVLHVLRGTFSDSLEVDLEPVDGLCRLLIGTPDRLIVCGTPSELVVALNAIAKGD